MLLGRPAGGSNNALCIIYYNLILTFLGGVKAYRNVRPECDICAHHLKVDTDMTVAAFNFHWIEFVRKGGTEKHILLLLCQPVAKSVLNYI